MEAVKLAGAELLLALRVSQRVYLQGYKKSGAMRRFFYLLDYLLRKIALTGK
jgi:hypothetical protein